MTRSREMLIDYFKNVLAFNNSVFSRFTFRDYANGILKSNDKCHTAYLKDLKNFKRNPRSSHAKKKIFNRVGTVAAGAGW